MKRVDLLGIHCDIITVQQTLMVMKESTENQTMIITLNPEMCLHAFVDPDFKKVIQQASLVVPDGFGILWAGYYMSGKRTVFRALRTLLSPWKTRKHSPFPERVSGVDLLSAYLRKNPQKKIFLLGASEEVNKRYADQLKREGVNIVGRSSASADSLNDEVLRKEISKTNAEVIFVAFGSPKQEFWIWRNLTFLSTVKLAMGVGGSFDFLSGAIPRAPEFFRKSGLEWLYRLWKEPKRIRRILRATVVFPWRVARHR